ncbi:hypothetical protein BKP35_18545 [Anaerobacillus arseniciselenatis]|uniref:UPF0473 protein BKP35_18545 n=1 Tax=Anaerobacillus arseniciselenatis TaxID=85682 RepID=A0A1S2L5B5_9BACI|nr:DUF1292 domain-containing protein [Anaerobacillus arseniciselenatis]OIJ07679.1 hypothetical protein BKP35_18545 [Anaerobacillus arseniciselenatis]
MEKAERERIIIPDENGDEHLFEVLFTFDIDATGKSYMVLVDAADAENDEEEMEVHAFRYEDKGEGEDDLTLHPIETDEEWDVVEEMLNTFTEGEEDE